MTLHEYLAIMSRISGKTFKYNEVDVEVYEKFPFPMAADLAAMYDFYARGNPGRDIVLTKKLNPKVLTFEEWATKNKNKL